MFLWRCGRRGPSLSRWHQRGSAAVLLELHQPHTHPPPLGKLDGSCSVTTAFSMGLNEASSPAGKLTSPSWSLCYKQSLWENEEAERIRSNFSPRGGGASTQHDDDWRLRSCKVRLRWEFNVEDKSLCVPVKVSESLAAGGSCRGIEPPVVSAPLWDLKCFFRRTAAVRTVPHPARCPLALMTPVAMALSTRSALGGAQTSARVHVRKMLFRGCVERICPKFDVVLPRCSVHPPGKFGENRRGRFQCNQANRETLEENSLPVGGNRSDF